MAYTKEQQAQLKGILKKYSDLGGTYYGAGSGTPYLQNASTIYKPKAPSQNLFQKVGAIGSQTTHMLGSAATGLGKFAVHTVEDVASAAGRAARTPFDLGVEAYQTHEAAQQSATLTKKLKQTNDNYRAGKLSKSDYQRQLQEIKDGLQRSSDLAQSSIKYGDEAKKDAFGVAETAVNLLTLGRYKPIETVATTLGKDFTEQSAKTGIEAILNQSGKKLENALTTIPAFRDLVARNTKSFVDLSVKQLAGESTAQFLTRNSKNIAIGLLIKRPILYQMNIGLAEDAYNKILEGKYSSAVTDAAWIAAQAIGGGPLGYFFRNTKRLGTKVAELTKGQGSFIDEVSQRINGNIGVYLEELKAGGAKEFAQHENTARIAQTVNMQIAGNDAKRAADNVLSHYYQNGIDPKTITPQHFLDDMYKWSVADKEAQKLGDNYVAVRWDSATKAGVARAVENAGDDLQEMVKAVQDIAAQPGNGFGNNEILMTRIFKAITESDSAASAAKQIRQISTVGTISKDIPAAVQKRLEKLGYSLAEPFGGRKTPQIDYNNLPKLVSEVSKGTSDIFDPAVAPQPVLDGLSGLLNKFGLSPESNTKVAYDKLSESLVSNLDRAGVTTELGLVGDDTPKGAKFILSKLQQYIDKQGPNSYLNIGTLGRGQQSALQDIRQMTIKEVREAIPGIDKTTAKKLLGAVNKSYTDVSLEFRGLGIKAFDYAYRIPGAKNYFRLQSALRYTYNPFFRAQELIETKSLAHMKASNLTWFKPGETPGALRARLDAASEILDRTKIFTSGYTGESTQDLTIGRIHANILKTQKRDLAGLALDLAEKQGLTLEQMAAQHPEQLADALRTIVQYPTKGVLNSPLARTLNIAFFPMRYNLKVTGLVAREVAKLPPSVQTAVIHSIFKTSDWLKSDEGIQWQADNQDAIQIFSYFTVYNNIAAVLHVLRGGKPNSVSELGQLGGLPFGVISQLLDKEGIIHLNTPYVDPKTGNVLPDYIPQTTKAKAAVALESLLNSVFTYPGRIIGLPGKSQSIRNLVDDFIKTGNSEYLKNIRTEDLTPLQQNMIRVLQGDTSQDAIDSLYISPAEGEYGGYTLPTINLPQPVAVMSKSELAAAKAKNKTTKKKKTALAIPAQGQSLQLP